MRMQVAYKIDLYKADNTTMDLSLIAYEWNLEEILEKVVEPGLDKDETYKVTKIVFSEMVDE